MRLWYDEATLKNKTTAQWINKQHLKLYTQLHMNPSGLLQKIFEHGAAVHILYSQL